MVAIKNIVRTVDMNKVLFLIIQSPYSGNLPGFNEKSPARLIGYGFRLDLNEWIMCLL